ncbi:hypothetical protein UFOVP1466_38 [uncultured Caudovirales phage]|uniref:Uncharacterized protein n=1 Tax=uncultured Caudovirales phage TaxID=2100421 RepID=A0A6J7XJ80_9CAUD|nr:hypothetical protein UFOVP1466_38 [uncultured Caudovirales phage]CAB5229474.1 hypothetical protein UFOVP1554_10 [uncultured Caudovirales phage]
MTKDEALKLALEALEDLGMKHFESTGEVLYKETFTAIKEALAQPAVTESHKQEPVAWATREDFYLELNRRVDRMREEMMIKTITMRCKEYDLALPIVDMYGGHIVVGQVSFPPQRKPLSEEEIGAILEDVNAYGTRLYIFVRAIEAAHGITGEKNGTR